jgi:hypothetical protein
MSYPIGQCFSEVERRRDSDTLSTQKLQLDFARGEHRVTCEKFDLPLRRIVSSRVADRVVIWY